MGDKPLKPPISPVKRDGSELKARQPVLAPGAPLSSGKAAWRGSPSYPTSVRPDWVLLSTCRGNLDSPHRFPKGWFPSPPGPLRKKKETSLEPCLRPAALPACWLAADHRAPDLHHESGPQQGSPWGSSGRPGTQNRGYTEQLSRRGTAAEFHCSLMGLRLGLSPCPYQKWRQSCFRRLCGLFLRAAPVQSAVDNCLGRRAGDAISQ